MLASHSGRRSPDAELLHPIPKRVGMEPENLSGAAWTVDEPVRLLKDVQNVISLYRFQGRAVSR